MKLFATTNNKNQDQIFPNFCYPTTTELKQNKTKQHTAR